MAHHEEAFKETCSPLWIPAGLIVLFAMPALPLTIGVTQIFLR